MNISDFFEETVRDFPDREAFVSAEHSVTYQQAHEQSEQIARSMIKAGFVNQQKVAIYSPNRVDAFLCILATFKIGGVWVPVNAKNAVADNAAFLELTECEWLFYHSSFVESVSRIKEQVPGITRFICIDKPSSVDIGLVDFKATAVEQGTLPSLVNDPFRQVMIFGTGGTTGRSKGVVWNNLTWHTLIAETTVKMKGDIPPVHLCVAPMTHAAGILALMLLPQGATNVVVDNVEPEEILACIERYQVTHLFLPPTLLYTLLAHADVRKHDYSSLTHFLIAASPVSSEKLSEAVEVFGPCMCQSYGQAEAPMLITYLSSEDIGQALASATDRNRLASCGRRGTFSVVEIMNENGDILPPGEKGEIVLRGNLVTPGYYGDSEATAEVRVFDWHHTGDLGYKDADGYFYIVDRLKDMIITGGFNVFSAEVENAVNDHSSVENCAVVGVPDEKWGEAVKAIVKLRKSAELSEEQLIAFVKDRLGSVKAPKSVEFWDELPSTPVGKIKKTAIRKRFWSERDRSVN